MIAALFVQANGCYSGLLDVDPWPIERDARRYDGPHAVVAHPPCARWCLLAGLVQARYGIRVGDDGGCFASALDSVRRYGGVLEHPAYTKAWKAYGLPTPPQRGAWTQSATDREWVTEVHQIVYGHRARKATWLYAVSVRVEPTPPDPMSRMTMTSRAWTSYCGNRNGGKEIERMSKKERNATPKPFRDALIAIARSMA